jgi:hypothetical protein
MIEYNTYGKPIEPNNLLELEDLLGNQLPEDYKAHMLKYNGGRVPYTKDCVIELNKSEYILGGFHQIDEVKKSYNNKILYPNYISIGDITGGYLAMGYKENNKGEIYVYFSDEKPYKIANSFTEFLESLDIRDVD